MNFFSEIPKLNIMESQIVGASDTSGSSSKFNSEIFTSNVNIYDIGHYFNPTVSN